MESDFPLADSAVIKELKEAECKAMKMAKMIECMKNQIAEYTKKDKLTEEDTTMLRQKQNELMAKMSEFEEITKHVQNLVGLREVTSSEVANTCRPGEEPGTVPVPVQPLEDLLPKIIVCGQDTGDEVPKIIICNDNEAGGMLGQAIGGGILGQAAAGGGGGGRQGICAGGGGTTAVGAGPGANQYRGGPPGGGGPMMGGGGGGWPPCGGGAMPPQFPPGGFPGPRGPPPPPGAWAPGFWPPPPRMPQHQAPVVDHLTGRLDASYKIQERLANDNMEMEGNRYQLQEALLKKDQAVDCLQKQVECLQNEMKRLEVENCDLRSTTQDTEPYPGVPLCKMAMGREPVCKRELMEQMCSPKDETREMECVVTSMEDEVRAMQKELAMVHQERKNLELQKKLLKCATMAQPAVCKRQATEAVSTSSHPSLPQPLPPPPASPPPPPPPPACVMLLQEQLRDLREQYQRLQEDYNAKVGEVSVLRVELDSSKRDSMMSLEKAEEAESRVDDLVERLKSVESEKFRMTGSKDQMIEFEQQLIVTKQRFRESQEELEEMRCVLQDQSVQMEEYRSKYMTKEQLVEEQRRQIDLLELENNRISEQVSLEIQRAKMHFQEKLQELTPLPDLLKATQLKLQECTQLRAIAERNCEEMGREVEELRDKNERLSESLDETRSNRNLTEAERVNLQRSLTDGERKMEDTKNENTKLKAMVARLEELALQNERRLEERSHESLQLQTQLETLREESARQVSRGKERCESIRRTMQATISELERQLAQSRAAARSAQRDRDEIRQRMQAQISQLNDNFEQAQMRIRSLQSHVNYLKTSYTNIFAPELSDAKSMSSSGHNSYSSPVGATPALLPDTAAGHDNTGGQEPLLFI